MVCSLNDLDLQNYRNCIGFVDQHFRVFEGRIRDNVTCGTVEDEKLLQSCLSRANITKKINELPNKEDTYVGRYLREEGINLSGGERQKISIARGLYKEGKILVLDEPTSAMDVFSRDYFEQKFLNHVDESILLYVTHNLRSIRKCDYIIVIENGEIVEIGKTKELFSNKNSIICQMMKSEYHFEKEQSSEVKSKIRRMTC